MPSWWKTKSKSSPNSARKKDKDKDSPSVAAEIVKEKARSFDETVVRRRRETAAGGGGVFRFEFDGDRSRAAGRQQQHAHPLPRPMISASVSMPHELGGGSTGASMSSVSSSGSSSEETADLGGYRYSEPVSLPRGRNFISAFDVKQHAQEEKHPLSYTPAMEHERVSHIPVSPRKDSEMNNIPVSPRKDCQNNNSNFSINGSAYSHHTSSTETSSRPGSVSPGPRSRGYPLPTSPGNSRVFGMRPDSPLGKQDDLRSPPHPLPLPPGSPTSPASRSQLSNWKKGKLLGSGTFGRVYAGFNSERGKMCAIKEVEVISDDSNSKECLKQLSQEINLLSQLSHPNIVQYYGSELVDGTLSVYLEYVSGGSIHKLLQDYGPFSEPVIRCYAGQILSGLAYLHGRNTLHRDIKGANILVGPNGEVKLADFGMAKHISSYTSIRSFKGSPYWMAPEVIMNTNGYGLPVDIWSLGCTIIEMATSKPPWNGFTGVQAIFKIGNSKDIPEIPDHLSSDAKKFLKLCLQRDPSARPTAAQLMDHPFVRDQAKVKISKVSTSRDAYPSSSDGARSPTGTDSAYNRSISPLQDGNYVNRSNSSLHDRNCVNRNNPALQDRDNPLRHTIGYSPLYIKTSEPVSLRMNMSLPVSPCSSPLRQFKETNRSCIPSPPHPMHAMRAPTYGLGNASPHQMFTSSRYTDRWSEVSQLNGLSPYGSPRKA